MKNDDTRHQSAFVAVPHSGGYLVHLCIPPGPPEEKQKVGVDAVHAPPQLSWSWTVTSSISIIGPRPRLNTPKKDLVAL